MKDRIYIQDWLEMKPYDKQKPTDLYYLRICNEIKEGLEEDPYLNYTLIELIGKKYVNSFICFIVSYFEDLISESGLWSAFIHAHKKLYGTFLPHYKPEEYYEDEINPEDIYFLTWYFVNSISDETYYGFNDESIFEISEFLFDYLDKYWEEAPENKELKKFYQIDEKEGDNIFRVKEFLLNIFTYSYLFYPDTGREIFNENQKIIKDFEDNEDLDELEKNTQMLVSVSENTDIFVLNKASRLLSLSARDWAAEILGENHPLYNTFLDMSPMVLGIFEYNGKSFNNYFLKHLGTGEEITVLKKKGDLQPELDEKYPYYYLNIIRWNNRWHIIGFPLGLRENEAKDITEGKGEKYYKTAFDFLEKRKKRIASENKRNYKIFLEFNNREPIVFLPADEIDNYVDSFKEFAQNYKQGKVTKNKHFDFDKNATETGLVFFNPNYGIEAVVNHNAPFAVPHNPYFDEKNAEDDLFSLFSSQFASVELINYCLENSIEKLPFLKKPLWKEILGNADFLMRFWRKELYYPEEKLVEFPI